MTPDRYPTEILKGKYVPLTSIYDTYGINVSTVKRLIKEGSLAYAEFTVPGNRYREIHVNPESLLSILEKENP